MNNSPVPRIWSNFFKAIPPLSIPLTPQCVAVGSYSPVSSAENSLRYPVNPPGLTLTLIILHRLFYLSKIMLIFPSPRKNNNFFVFTYSPDVGAVGGDEGSPARILNSLPYPCSKRRRTNIKKYKINNIKTNNLPYI